MSRQPARSQNHRAESKPEASPGISSSSQYASSYFMAPSSSYISPYSPLSAQPTTTIISPQPTTSFDLSPRSVEASAIGSRATSAAAMSTYSSSSQGSIYSNTSPQQHRVATPGMMNNPGDLSAVSAKCKVILSSPDFPQVQPNLSTRSCLFWANRDHRPSTYVRCVVVV